MGMVFGIRGRDAGYEQEPRQRKQVPYKLASYEHDHEGKRFRSSNVVYSFWSAAKYTLILSLVLWWLPMFGQMIAGYVGGRRAGGPWKGVAAAIVPVVCLYAVMKGFETGTLPSTLFGVSIAPAAIGAALTGGLPFLSPYLQFSSEYVGDFVQMLEGASPYGINVYVLTVAFAYVGGVIADQNRREIAFNSGAVTSSTTVLVQDMEGALAETHERHARRGVTHALSSRLPWHKEHERMRAAHARMLPGRRDDWARAVDMRFADPEAARGGAYASADLDYEHAPQQTWSSANAPKRHHRPQNAHPTRRHDPWIRADRRARHTFSSARRFSEPQRERDSEVPSFQHHGRTAPRYVPGDPKSIKRTRRVIDSEWGGRANERVLVETQAQPKKHHEPSHSQWETI